MIKNSKVLLGSMFLMAAFILAVSPGEAKAYSQAEIEKLIKDTSKLVIQNKQPTAAQKKMIDDLAAQVKSGQMKRDYIVGLAKKEIFSLVDTTKFNRYDIRRAMKVVGVAGTTRSSRALSIRFGSRSAAAARKDSPGINMTTKSAEWANSFQ